MPWMEPMLTIVPEPCATIISPKARVMEKSPVALVRIEDSHSESGAWTLFIGRDTALLTRPSIRPKSARIESRRRSTEASSP